MSNSALSPLTAEDGENIAVFDWPLDEGHEPRGVVLMVHGLGEHAWRYAHVAEQLNAWGFAVRAYDQHGHGESGGVRGAMPHANKLLDDLADVIDDTLRLYPGKPRIVLGHSLGGLLAAHFVSLHKDLPISALVLSSPALNIGLRWWQRLALPLLAKLLGNLRVRNGLPAQYLSHDAQVQAAYLRDPLVHHLVALRLVRYMAQAGPKVIAAAAQWKMPTLLMYAGDDHLLAYVRQTCKQSRHAARVCRHVPRNF
jgi:alpha-beta hydrolase superfamily lysophospholipase